MKRERVYIIEEDEEQEQRKDLDIVGHLLLGKLNNIRPSASILSVVVSDMKMEYGCNMEAAYERIVDTVERVHRIYLRELAERKKTAALCFLRLMKIRDIRKMLVSYVEERAKEEEVSGMLEFCCRHFVGRHHEHVFWKDERILRLLGPTTING